MVTVAQEARSDVFMRHVGIHYPVYQRILYPVRVITDQLLSGQIVREIVRQ